MEKAWSCLIKYPHRIGMETNAHQPELSKTNERCCGSAPGRPIGRSQFRGRKDADYLIKVGVQRARDLIRNRPFHSWQEVALVPGLTRQDIHNPLPKYSFVD